LKTQSVEFSADRKVSIENSKRSILSKILSFELELMSTFVYFNRILWFILTTEILLTLQKPNTVATLLSFHAVISNLKTQLHAVITR
jgi:hypothetical protein